MNSNEYPFTPKSNAKLRPGQFFAIRLSDGRFACGRVLGIDRAASYGSRTNFVAGVLDWVADVPPTNESIAGAPVIAASQVHFRAIGEGNGEMLGHRDLDLDGLAETVSVDAYAGDAWPSQVAEARFVLSPRPPGPELREVSSPLTEEMLDPMPGPGGTVQFSVRLTDDDFARLGEWFEDHRDVGLRAYGSYDGSITDLEFLRWFPHLTDFSADALDDSLESLDGLRHLPESARELRIGRTHRPLDLAILERFTGLECLYLEGQTKGIEILGGLRGLEDLTLRSVTLPDLSVLLPLDRLLAFDLKLGGTRDISLLPQIGRLEYVELWMVRGLVDLSAIAEVHTLRYLFLESLRRVEELPDLRELRHLVRIHLQNIRGLKDLSPLAGAPALTSLVLEEMGHLQPEDLSCLAGHPTLRAISPRLGGRRKTEAAREVLGLPDAGGKVPWRTVAGLDDEEHRA